MDPGTDSPGVGSSVSRHRLGPHVVGQRVVVRRLLRGETGPSGGPAMTDAIGVCTSWEGGVCVLLGDRGPVRIQIADIVSGKPVPPRPSIRHRITPAEAQRRALALWPDLVMTALGDWTLRTSDSSTARRANSVLAMDGEPGTEEPVAEVVEHYDRLNRRPIAALLPGSTQDALFLARGWVPESADAPTLFQLASVAKALRALEGVDPSPATISGGEDFVTVRVVRGGSDGSEPAEVAASGVAAYADDWVGFRSIEVAPEHRRAGLGRVVMSALLEWGAQRGARTAYLQVLGHNGPALALYEGLGFETHHAYRYLAAPQD